MALLAPAAASASTVSADEQTIYVSAAPGETNHVEISQPGVTLEVKDTAGITAGAGCEQLSATHVRCPATAVQDKAIVDLGDGNDFYQDVNAHMKDDINGGAGNDEIVTTLDDDIVRGQDGNDKIRGGSGDDQLDGGAGDDEVQGAAHNDTIIGGTGQDLLEGDGPVNDDGADTIFANDNGEKDTVSCDNGVDTVTADRVDTIDQLCEDVTIVDCDCPLIDELQISVSLASTMKLTKFLKRGLGFKATFNGPATYAGGLFVAKKTAKKFGLGNKTIAIASGGGIVDEAGTFKVRITKLAKKKKLRALLDRDGFKRLPVVFEALATNEAGDEVTVRKKLRLTA